jgi:lipocalin
MNPTTLYLLLQQIDRVADYIHDGQDLQKRADYMKRLTREIRVMNEEDRDPDEGEWAQMESEASAVDSRLADLIRQRQAQG